MKIITCAIFLMVLAGASFAGRNLLIRPRALGLDDVVAVDLNNQPFWNAEFSSGSAGITSGRVYFEPPQLQEPAMRKLTLHIASTTVRAALDTLTKLDGSYSWLADGNVIVFLPKQRNTKFIDPIRFLDQTIPSFSAQDVGMTSVIYELEAQATAQGVKDFWRDPKNTSAGREEARQMERRFEGTFSLELSAKTVRQCLDSIVAMDQPATWIAVPHHDWVFVGVLSSYAHRGKMSGK